ncbi:hypothetical protein MBLNU459_g1996t1 [Dothideomycetes sp. NU459]
MFGLIISGRPVLAEPTQISQTQYAFRIPTSPPFSHLGAFLLPGNALPVDVGATVWVQIPPSSEFRLLGALAQAKQSAIFKINTGSGAGSPQQGAGGGDDVMADEAPGVHQAAAAAAAAAAGAAEIVVGISLEPAAQVEAQLATLRSASASASAASAPPSTALVRSVQPAGSAQTPPSASASPVSTKVLAQRIIGNAFNFLASFGSDTVPLKAFQDWWVKFEKKVEFDPTFLEREQG